MSCPCPAGVKTNIVEQITFYGKPTRPRGPGFPVLEAETVGELVAEGVSAGRFLILTAPEAADEIRERGADFDAYLSRLSAESAIDEEHGHAGHVARCRPGAAGR